MAESVLQVVVVVVGVLNRHPYLTSKSGIPSTLIKKYNIQPYNIYNMDEKNIQMGKSVQVKVICIRGKKYPPLMKDGSELFTAIEQMVYTFRLELFIRDNHSLRNGISILMRRTRILFFQFHLKGAPARFLELHT